MKAVDLKNLYSVPAGLHERVRSTLNSLDEEQPARFRRYSQIRRVAVVSVVTVVLAAFSTAAYATGFFGLLSERVGKYGLNMHIVTEATPDSSAEKRFAKPNPTYLPKGCCQLIGEDDDFQEILNPEGVTSYNSNGNYKYTDGKGVWVHFHVYEAETYHEEARYIVDSFEKEYGGHKTIFLTRQFEDNGDRDHYAVKYFEDWGYVVDCYYDDADELMKIMEGLELQEPEEEAAGYLVPPTIDIADDPYAGYAFSMTEEEREYQLGETFKWSEQIVNAPSPLYCYKDGECEITVKSVKEHDGVKGLDKSKLLAPDDEEWYSRYFNPDGSLKTPYIRIDRENGDGIDSLGHSAPKEIGRHFYLVTIEVKAVKEQHGDFRGQFMTNAGGAIYQDKHNENGSEMYTVGVIADEDESDDLKLLILSRETVIDDQTETIVCREIRTVIPIGESVR